MEKKELRQKYLQIRKNIELNNKKKYDEQITEQIVELKDYKQSNLILTYVSIEDEVDTIKLIEYSLKKQKKVAVPKCEKNIINFYYINSLNDLIKGCFGILEPLSTNRVKDFKNSICIIPGVCFDKEKNRIGYGKGYYDKFLERYDGIKIGISYKQCICDKIDVDNYDIRMDKIICNL